MTHLLKITLFFLSLQTLAQTAQFEMLFYFIDSLGNRDTLTLGYDTLADPNQINTIFGEELITELWDSVFEVRASQKYGLVDDQLYSKKVIMPAIEEIPNCYRVTNYSKLFVYAKYPPVTMYYDKTLLYEARCEPENTWLFLTGLWGFLGVEIDVLPDSLYHCIASNDSIELNPKHWYNTDFCEICLYLETGDTIANEIAYFQFSNWGFSLSAAPYCEEIEVAIPTIKQPTTPNIYPNPFSDKLYIDLKETATITIYNNIGKIILTTTKPPNQKYIDLSHLNTGIYYLQIETPTNRSTQKILKQ